MANDPIIKPTVPAGGITALTGDVTAGPGSGSQVASIADGAVGPATISTDHADSFTFPATLVVDAGALANSQLTMKGTSHDVLLVCEKGSNDRLYIQSGGVTGLIIDGAAGTVQLSALAFNGNTQPIRTNNGMSCGTQSLDASAVFEADSTTKGALLPRMTATQRDAITSPAEGLEIYNLDSHTKNFWNGTVWKVVATV